MAEEKNFAEIEIVFLGRRLHSDGKLYAYYIPFPTFALLFNGGAAASVIRAKASPYGDKNSPSVVCGVYSCEAAIEGDTLQSIRFGSLKWLRSVEGNVAAVLFADDKAARLAKRTKTEEAKAAKATSLDAMIDDLAQVYRGINPANRQAFKMMLLERLDRAGWGK